MGRAALVSYERWKYWVVSHRSFAFIFFSLYVHNENSWCMCIQANNHVNSILWILKVATVLRSEANEQKKRTNRNNFILCSMLVYMFDIYVIMQRTASNENCVDILICLCRWKRLCFTWRYDSVSAPVRHTHIHRRFGCEYVIRIDSYAAVSVSSGSHKFIFV